MEEAMNRQLDATLSSKIVDEAQLFMANDPMTIRLCLRFLATGLTLIFSVGVLLLMLQSSRFGLPVVNTIVRLQFPQTPQITPDQLSIWLNDTNRIQPLLLDVRTEEEFVVSHLPDATRVDPNATMAELENLIATSRPLVAYCSVGYRSSAMADRIRQAGGTNVFNLEGSIFSWANSGYPLNAPSSPTGAQVHPYNEFATQLLSPPLRANVPSITYGPMEGLLHGLWQSKMILSITMLFLLLAFETLSPFFAFYRGNPGERLRSDTRNVLLGTLNAVVVATVFVALWFWTARWAEHTGFGLLNWLGLTGWAHVALGFLLFDLWMYWWHRWNHLLPFFWRFHRVHHSDPRMDVTTANRFHFGEIIMSSALRIPVIALLGIQLWALVLYELVMFTNVQIHHANIGLPPWVERFLGRFIVTPGIHKVHHSHLQVETDSNYGALFTFWDRLFGSIRVRQDLQNIQFGLDDVTTPKQLGLVGQLALPLHSPNQSSVDES